MRKNTLMFYLFLLLYSCTPSSQDCNCEEKNNNNNIIEHNTSKSDFKNYTSSFKIRNYEYSDSLRSEIIAWHKSLPKEVKDKKLGNIELFQNRVIRARSLTKKFLFNLPHGVYVMSNCFEGFDTPIFFRQITPDSDLDAFWQEILDVKANHRAVWVFPNLESAEEWIKRLSGR